MARVPLIEKPDVAGLDEEIFDKIVASRGAPPGNIWKALMNAPKIAEKALGIADELRHGVDLEKAHRELAALMVGRITKCQYEIDHHWASALKAGIKRDQLDALDEFETSPLFDPRERVVLRFSKEITECGRVSDETWSAIGEFCSHKTVIELVMTIAWYNTVVRILLPLEIENESTFKRA